MALAEREMEMESYYKLIATGLGCLETVLRVGHAYFEDLSHHCPLDAKR